MLHSVLDVVCEYYHYIIISILLLMVYIGCIWQALNLWDHIREMSAKKVAYYCVLDHVNIVAGCRETYVGRLPGNHCLDEVYKELASNLSREYNGETESVTHLIRRHCLAVIYRVFLSKDILDQINYMGLVMAAKLGHVRAMRKYLESGVKPMGPDGDLICTAPLLAAMRKGPGPTKLLLEYGALTSNWAKLQLDTDFLISCPMSVIKTLVEYGDIPTLSLARLEEAIGYVTGNKGGQPIKNKVEVLKKIAEIKALVRKPLSLVSLARNAVVECLGPMPERRGKLPSTGLPNIWQKELSMSDGMDLSMVRTVDNDVIITFLIMPY